MEDMAIVKFLELLGWGDWFRTFFQGDNLNNITFADLTLGTLPFMLQLFFVILLLNWIMGIIGDVTKIIAKGGRL